MSELSGDKSSGFHEATQGWTYPPPPLKITSPENLKTGINWPTRQVLAHNNPQGGDFFKTSTNPYSWPNHMLKGDRRGNISVPQSFKVYYTAPDNQTHNNLEKMPKNLKPAAVI